MSYSDSKDARIGRLACHKVASDALGPIPRSSKGDVTDAALAKYQKSFVEFCDWLMNDADEAGNRFANGGQTATMKPVESEPEEEAGDTPEFSLEAAMALTEKIKSRTAGDSSLKQAVKLKLVALGVGNLKSLEDAVMKLNGTQAAELEKLIDKG